MKKFFLIINFLIFFALFNSCIRDNPYIKIKNNSSFLIDSVEVYANPKYKTKFKNIKPNETRRGIILFKNMPKQDGVSVAKIYFKNQVKERGLSYFTNGASLDYGYKILIENDSIYIDNY